MLKGSLTIVGTGIRLSHLSVESRSHIESAEKLLYAVADTVTESWLKIVNPAAESLAVYYSTQKLRRQTYHEMVDRIMACVKDGHKVCAVFYGHPGVFANPAHDVLQQARQAGFRAQMLPAISAEDCLFADLGFDPGRNGCQSFEASDFLISRRRPDSSIPLILWQIGLTGEMGYKKKFKKTGLRVLIDVLLETYSIEHEVVIYQAAQYFNCNPRIDRVPLASVLEADVTLFSTLFIPAISRPNPDPVMLSRLGLKWEDIGLPNPKGSRVAKKRTGSPNRSGNAKS